MLRQIVKPYDLPCYPEKLNMFLDRYENVSNPTHKWINLSNILLCAGIPDQLKKDWMDYKNVDSSDMRWKTDPELDSYFKGIERKLDEYLRSDQEPSNTPITGAYRDTPLASGLGMYHTATLGSRNPKPYDTISLDKIIAMVSNPVNVPKSKAQWVIFSTDTSENARSSDHQKKHGLYVAGWGDVDKGNSSRDDIIEVMVEFKTNFMLYATKSATEENKKWRIIVPYETALNASDHAMWCSCFNDHLVSKGIIIDEVNTKPSQIAFLPNKGEFYQYHIEESRGDLT